MNLNIWDIFISHASEDKDKIARPLANILTEKGLKVWLDEAELKIGDSLREKIDDGLSKSQFGTVILSPDFFSKKWTNSELNGLFAKDLNIGKVLLPIWHNVEYEDVLKYSPMLADRLAINTKKGLSEVSKKIVESIKISGKNQRIDQPIYAGRVSKKKLMDFPSGCIIMTNIINPVDYTPLYTRELTTKESREKFWGLLRAQNITTHKCYVFANAEGYRKHLNNRDIWLPIEEDSRWKLSDE